MTKPRIREVFATTAWFIWSHRNKTRLQERTVPLSGIREAVCQFMQPYSFGRVHPASCKLVRQCKWQPPNPGEYKTNFDGAMFTESDEAGLGVVVRDSNGLVVAAMAEKIKQPHSVECLEMSAARRAVIFVKEIGLQDSHFEGDSELVIKELQRDGLQFSSIGHLARDTLSHVSSLRSFPFTHVVRQCIAVENALAQRARLSFPFCVWMESVSSNIDTFVCTDFRVFN